MKPFTRTDGNSTSDSINGKESNARKLLEHFDFHREKQSPANSREVAIACDWMKVDLCSTRVTIPEGCAETFRQTDGVHVRTDLDH